MLKKALVFAGIAVGVLVVAAVAAAAFIDINHFRPMLEEQLASAVGRKVTIGRISLSILSGSIGVDDVTIADDPKFGPDPFVTAKSLRAGIELMPLIVSRQVRIDSITLDAPHITVVRTASGDWNFATLGAASSSKPAASSSASTPLDLLVHKLAVRKGQLTVVTRGSRTPPRVYDDLSLDASELSYSSAFPFRVRATTPGHGSVMLDGKAGPIDMKDASETPVHAALEVKNLDIAATGFVDPASGLSGLVGLDAALASDGKHADLKGKVRAEKLRLVPAGSAARVPFEIDYHAEYDLRHRSGTVRQGDVHIGKAIAHLTGTYASGDDVVVHMKLAGHQLPAAELQGALPALGMTLPAGASIQEGTLDLDLAINGPVDKLVISGPVAMANTRVKDFDLGGKMATVAAFAGVPKSGDTIIETLRSDLRVAPDGIRAADMNVVVKSVGNLTGGGTIAPQGTLDFRMVGSVGSVHGVPFKVQGTMTNPVFVPDAAAAMKSVLSSPDKAAGAAKTISGLFKKKH